MTVRIAALRERPEENRVALTPTVAGLLVSRGLEVTIETEAGLGAGFTDDDYAAAGATIVDADTAYECDIVACVDAPSDERIAALSDKQVLIGLVGADTVGDSTSVLALERLPRQVSRAQTMDALSSQSSVAGYRAALVAAHEYGRYLPMMVTAAGTAKPASVLVLGAGVAGLQAIATARRLGSRVTGYDVRPAAREEVTSLGAAFLDTSVDAVGEGGYARELSAEEAATQRAELAQAIATFDIVITTARVPGRRPPELVTADTVAVMRRGSVIVDMGASELGGNVAGSVPGQTVITDSGVTLIGANDLPSQMAPAASDAYARNIAAVVAEIVTDGALLIDPTDEVIGALLGAPVTATEGDSA